MTIKVLTPSGYQVVRKGDNGFVCMVMRGWTAPTYTPAQLRVTFAYTWSAEQHLGPGVGHWHPHMMVFAPNYKNSTLGDNDFAKPLPFVSDDAGTPFAVVVIPLDDRLAIKAELKRTQTDGQKED